MLHRTLEEKVSASERRLRAESDQAREDRLGQAEAVAELSGKVDKLTAAVEVLLRHHSDDAGRVDHESPPHPRTPPPDPPAHESRAPVDPHAVGSAHGALFTVPEEGYQSAQVTRVMEKLRSVLPRPPQKEEAKLHDETVAYIKIEFGRYLAFGPAEFRATTVSGRTFSSSSPSPSFENADATRRYCGPDAAVRDEIVSMDAPPMSHFMATTRLEAERRHLQALANAKISGSTLPSGGAASGSAAASGSSHRRRRDDRRQQARPADSSESPVSQPPTVAKRTASPGKPPGNAKGREAK